MFKNKFTLCSLLFAFCLAGCAGQTGWNAQYVDVPVGAATQMQSNLYGTPSALGTNAKTVSVLLPDSTIGKNIKSATQMAFVGHKNINATFYKMSGTQLEKQNTVLTALATNPDIIIGPVFADDTQIVRELKPPQLPVLTFSSDTRAIGDGIMTMALMPMQSVEIITNQIAYDGANSVVAFAPKNATGARLAGAAVYAANSANVKMTGLFYYEPGNTDSIKNAAERGAMWAARTGANEKAREILSDILVKENLTAAQKSSLHTQLNKISKSDTLGDLPYDAVLFLGDAADTKTLASFLRYYDVAKRDVDFYGTALWDGTDIVSDITMIGAKYAALPQMSDSFTNTYNSITGLNPSRIDSFGYDAVNLAIGMLNSGRPAAEYLLSPSGYNGLDGLFRLRPNGVSERALNVMEITGAKPLIARSAPENFIIPIYQINPYSIPNSGEIDLRGDGINPMDYIKIPDNLRGKYKSKTFGANTAPIVAITTTSDVEITVLPEDDSEIIPAAAWTPAPLENIDRKLIDSVEISE